MNALFTKSFAAIGGISAHRIVALGAGGVQTAAANTDPLLGVTGSLGAEAGQMVDVDLAGFLRVQAGGAISAGDPLTADADGKAVKAEPVAGEIVRTIGYALDDALADDILPFFAAPGLIATPEAA